MTNNDELCLRLTKEIDSFYNYCNVYGNTILAR